MAQSGRSDTSTPRDIDPVAEALVDPGDAASASTTAPTEANKTAGPEPRFYVVRPDNTRVPLIPVDELPGGLQIMDLPRSLASSNLTGMKCLGRFAAAGSKYKLANRPANPGPATGAANLPPSGIWPDESRKVYCTKWLSTGTCDFAQQGCRYKHEMPTDRATLEAIGRNGKWPKWYMEWLGQGTRGKQRARPSKGQVQVQETRSSTKAGKRGDQFISQHGGSGTDNHSSYRAASAAAAAASVKAAIERTRVKPVVALGPGPAASAAVESAPKASTKDNTVVCLIDLEGTDSGLDAHPALEAPIGNPPPPAPRVPVSTCLPGKPVYPPPQTPPFRRALGLRDVPPIQLFPPGHGEDNKVAVAGPHSRGSLDSPQTPPPPRRLKFIPLVRGVRYEDSDDDKETRGPSNQHGHSVGNGSAKRGGRGGANRGRQGRGKGKGKGKGHA